MGSSVHTRLLISSLSGCLSGSQPDFDTPSNGGLTDCESVSELDSHLELALLGEALSLGEAHRLAVGFTI